MSLNHPVPRVVMLLHSPRLSTHVTGSEMGAGFSSPDEVGDGEGGLLVEEADSPAGQESVGNGPDCDHQERDSHDHDKDQKRVVAEETVPPLGESS